MNLRQNDRCLYLAGTQARTYSHLLVHAHTRDYTEALFQFFENEGEKKEKKIRSLIVSQSWLHISFLLCFCFVFFPPWPLVQVSLTAKEAI